MLTEGQLAVGHMIAYAVFIVPLLLFPIGRILSRIGFSPLWSIIIFIPLANLAGLWVVALWRWPIDREELP